MTRLAKLGRASVAVAAFTTFGIVGAPQPANALTCTLTAQITGARQSSGTSMYYGNWLNIYNYNHEPNICALVQDVLMVEMPSTGGYVEFGFEQDSGDPATSDTFFTQYAAYPAGDTTVYFGTASTGTTYSIRAFDSATDGEWTLDETAGSTFTTLFTTPFMAASTGLMSGDVIRLDDGDAALLTNWADTQNRHSGGWGHWTNEVCEPGSNIPDWKMNFGTIGDFHTSNFTHSGAC
jgi:hypothetical protein